MCIYPIVIDLSGLEDLISRGRQQNFTTDQEGIYSNNNNLVGPDLSAFTLSPYGSSTEDNTIADELTTVSICEN